MEMESDDTMPNGITLSAALITKIGEAEQSRDHHARMAAQCLFIGRLDMAMAYARQYHTAEDEVVRLYREMETTS